MADYTFGYPTGEYPRSPPPPYSVIANHPAQIPQPVLLHRQQSPSDPYIQQATSEIFDSNPSWPSPTGNTFDTQASAIALRTSSRRGSSNQARPAVNVNCNERTVTTSLNQSAALCDRVASRLSDVLCRFEGDDSQSPEDLRALVRELDLDEDDLGDDRRELRNVTADRGDRPRGQASGGIISFKKTWMYANSRLPPQMMPLKVYHNTWSIFCRAADASMAVYNRPKSNERQEYIDADWRQGTKAMALKSVCLDEKRLIVFAIRGSKWNLFDWAVNFRPAPTEPVGFLDDTGNACHAGFLHVAKATVPRIAARLRLLLEQDPGRAASSLVLTGHSAGGAVASLLFMHMMSTLVESELNVLTGCFRRVHCITFGAPPVSLLPLQTPNGRRNKKNIFVAFANEGDLVVRADRQYVASLCRLIAAPAPLLVNPKPSSHALRAKVSRQKLRRDEGQSAYLPAQAPWWAVPDATLSNAGRIVLLRKMPARKQTTEAVCVSDQELRHVLFGDPSMHDMDLYRQRIEELAIAAVTGRDGGS